MVADQVLSPTYAPDLAAAIVALVEAGARGLFHVTNDGRLLLARAGHGRAAASRACDVPVQAIKAKDLGRARRASRLLGAVQRALPVPGPAAAARAGATALRELLAE